MGRRTNLLYEHELYQSKVKIKKTQIEIFFVKQDSPRRNMWKSNTVTTMILILAQP